MAAIFYKNVINIDKLTQGVTLICLLIDFPRLAILLFGLLIKEFLLGIMELYSIKKTGVVHGANWHGKLNLYISGGIDESGNGAVLHG